MSRRTQTFQLPAAPQVTWYGVEDNLGNLMLYFECSQCGDQTQRRCENFARSPHWASQYALNHVHGPMPLRGW